MKAIGYVLVMFSIFLYYEAFKGRTMPDVLEDIKAITRGAFSLDFDAINAAVSHEGTLKDATASAEERALLKTAQRARETGGGSMGAVYVQARRLGEAAKGYRLTGTGPDYYDCSGLIWRAMKDTGFYTGPRFSTYSFKTLLNGRWEKVDAPQQGDILWWKGHMGIAQSPTQMYHAASKKTGIGFANIQAMETSLRSKYGKMEILRMR